MKKIILSLITIAGLTGLYAVDQWQIRRWQADRDLRLYTLSVKCRIQLDKAFEIRFNAVEALNAFFKIHAKVSPEKFAAFASHLMASNPPIRALQWADKKTRVTYVYPPKKNEITISKPMLLITDPKRGPFVRKAINEKKAIVQGPFNLRQGGIGLVLRSPIFNEENQFSGLAIGVFDVPALINEGLGSINETDTAFHLVDDTGKTFFEKGDPEQKGVMETIRVGDKYWRFHLNWQKGGLSPPILHRIIIWGFGGCFLLAILGFSVFLSYQNQQLSVTVKRQTRDLTRQNQQLTENITQLEQSKKLLKKNEVHFKRLFENAPIGIQLYDKKGRLSDINSSGMQIFGIRKKEDVLAFNLFKDPNLPENFKRDLLDGKPVHYETDFDFEIIRSRNFYPTTRNGIINLEVFITPLALDTGTKSRFITHVMEITEKIKTRKMLSEHQKLALVGQIAGKMAHDFNNVLGIIMGNTELALFESNEPATKDVLELILDQTQRGKNLTKNLIAFAKQIDPKLEFFNIEDKLKLVIEIMKRDLRDIEVRFEIKQDVPHLFADTGMIEHALVNLVQNAIHALSRTQYPEIIIRTDCDEKNIYIQIEDNGCGVPRQHIEKIWEPSFTLKGGQDHIGAYSSGVKGTGYGLANVKKYIQQHGGKVTFESDEQKGTKVTISMPVIKKGLTQKDYKEIKTSSRCFNKNILLVEDEPAIRKVQHKILTDAPCRHQVDWTGSGAAAINFFDTRNYDLVSLDYILEDKTSGIEVYNHIRQSNSDMPVLFVSGNIEFLESIAELRKKDHRMDHISKPCSNMKYFNAIHAMLEKCDSHQS